MRFPRGHHDVVEPVPPVNAVKGYTVDAQARLRTDAIVDAFHLWCYGSTYDEIRGTNCRSVVVAAWSVLFKQSGDEASYTALQATA